MSPTRLHIVLVALVSSQLACSEVVGTVDDLRLDFRLQPATVQAGAPMLAALTITNPTSDTITLHSGSSCVTTLDVLRDGERIDMQGTAFGCYAVVSAFPIPPHDSLVRVFDLVAMLREAQSPWRYVEAPVPGSYQLRGAMQVDLPDQYANFQVLQ